MDRDTALQCATTDPRTLTYDAYQGDQHLAARQRLYDFQRPAFDLPGLALDALADRLGTLIDVGCGNGRYLRRTRDARPDLNAVGLDLSPTLLGGLAPPVLCADASSLPLADESADIVLAMHMLYHLGDVDAGLAELARVLRLGGILIASTNADDDKHELDDLWTASAGEVLGTAVGPRRIKLSRNFDLDRGAAMLRAHFATVEVTELRGVIEVPSPEPVLAHLGSYRSWARHAGVPFDDALNRAAARLRSHIHRHGTFTITTRQGILTATRS